MKCFDLTDWRPWALYNTNSYEWLKMIIARVTFFAVILQRGYGREGNKLKESLNMLTWTTSLLSSYELFVPLYNFHVCQVGCRFIVCLPMNDATKWSKSIIARYNNSDPSCILFRTCLYLLTSKSILLKCKCFLVFFFFVLLETWLCWSR